MAGAQSHRGLRARLFSRLVLGLAVALGAGATPAPGEEPGILACAIEQARRDHPHLDATNVAAQIADLAESAHARLESAESPAARAEVLAALLFSDKAFESTADLRSLDTLHIDTVLANHRGYCLSLSIVLLAVAEKLGEPLHGVAAPNHFFVRYDDGEFKRNIELTRRGALVTDDDLRARFMEGAPESSAYLRNLSNAEVSACLLHNRGYVKLCEGDRAAAELDLREAIKRFPGLAEAHRNLGVLLGESGKHEEAIASCDRALALHPIDVEALANRATSRHALGRTALAIDDLEVALSIAPGRQRLIEFKEHLSEELARTNPQAWQGRKVRSIESPPPGLQPGLEARFFAGIAFEKEVATRIDADLDFDWKNDAPAPAVPRDRFSVRWRGWLRIDDPGTYTIFAVANDGVRVWVDENLVFDRFEEMGLRNTTVFEDLELIAGWHRVRIEHFDASGGARLMLRIGQSGHDTLALKRHLFHESASKSSDE